MIRRTIHFTGRVQGVGFRACTASIARNHDVAGTVENLPDGRVRLEVQGERSELDVFLDAIDRELGRHVRHREVADATPEPRLGDPAALNAFRVLR
ncbi:acylphosphatase [Phycisphaera mikurensis]|uniref:acylphosphatase n=1 Tax=Phycisphaera mikurensis (strain NBRC 102666 / KCTC 22515 / FYK2301M01) TaxID=1142394 RepID=I0IJ01_PHYMF|nr:acylphosphatase [Phycisphaera mikurensis]MBB6443086.1 acylphosphatase [Phycisphaera mikurensis]BAM05239.1 putative acylphosphatase [Phycisphaera mikurensis NBRC 102666]